MKLNQMYFLGIIILTVASTACSAVPATLPDVDLDNVNGLENEAGIPISCFHQLLLNLWLAQTTHAYDLGISLKNDLNQINDLLPYFDWVLKAECFS